MAGPREVEPPVAQKTDSATSKRKHPAHKGKPGHSSNENQNPYTLIKEQ